MKLLGQMVFEFVIAVIVFLALVIYTMGFVNVNVGSYGESMLVNEVENRAVGASEVLVKSRGMWDGSTPKSVGLADNWPVLDKDKIKKFIDFCKDRFNRGFEKDVFEKLDLGNYSGAVNISSVTLDYSILCGRSSDCFCGESVPAARAKAYVRRYGLVKYNNEMKVVAVDVWVWKI